MDPGQSAKRRAVDTQDFMAVVLVGHGRNLYPFNEGTNVLPKALMPVGNVPIINLVLDWVFAAGLTDVLVITPPAAASAISEYLQLEYQANQRITVKAENDGESDDEDDEGQDALLDKDGTARLLKRFRGDIKNDFVLLPCDISFPSTLTLASILDKHRATPDAVLTSVFYEPPEVVKEAAEELLVGTDKETNELLLVQGLDTLEENLELRMGLLATHPTLSLTKRLLDAHVYVFRRTVLDLLATRKSSDLSSVREQFVPWLVKGAWQSALAHRWAPILNPPKRDPFADALARSTSTSWRDAISLAAPDTPSSTHSDHTPLPTASAPSTGAALAEFKAAVARNSKNARHGAHGTEAPAGWSCRVIVSRPEAPPAPASDDKPASGKGKGGGGKGKPPAPGPEPEYIVRANSIAGYWEINRRMVRTLGAANAAAAGREKGGGAPSGGVSGGPAQAAPAAGAAAAPGAAPEEVASSAQISPDSLIGEGVRVGDRASIKKCVIGRHCVIGKNARLTGCVLWDFVTVEDGARIENSILCPNVRVGEKASVNLSELGPGFEVKPGSALKGEKLVAGQE